MPWRDDEDDDEDEDEGDEEPREDDELLEGREGGDEDGIEGRDGDDDGLGIDGGLGELLLVVAQPATQDAAIIKMLKRSVTFISDLQGARRAGFGTV